jgi:hypothetical protein
MEWEVEKLANAEGFSLEAIYPFEDLVLGALGYNRKRTYNDDIFPTYAAAVGTGNIAYSQTQTQPQKQQSDADAAATGTGVLVNSCELKELLERQQSLWRDNTVSAWSFVFVRKNEEVRNASATTITAEVG